MRISANDGGGEGVTSGSERNAREMNQLFLFIPSRNVLFCVCASSGGGTVQERGGGDELLGFVRVLTRDLYQCAVVSVNVPIVFADGLSEGPGLDCDE